MSFNSDGGDRPVFLIGAQRSGTTMLRYMLSAHPHIYVPPESNFLLHFLSLPPHETLSEVEAENALRTILTYRVFFRDWEGPRPDPKRFVRETPDRTLVALLRKLYRRYARQHGAERWGDKSPIYTEHVAELARFFPTAQFVHIIRDGRDVALSMQKAYRGARFFYVDLCYAARTWRRRVENARAAGMRLGSQRYVEVRYEQITAAPQEALQGLCEFLEEPFVPPMLQPDRVASAHYHSTGIHAATRKPLTTRSVGRWRKEMSAADQRLFTAYAGNLLDELGYQPGNLGRSAWGEYGRLWGLQAKYALVMAVQRALRAGGVVHPAALMAQVTRMLRRSV